MAQLSDDCFAHGGSLITVDDALSALRSRLIPVVERETVALRAAAGRFIAQSVTAPISVPRHDNSAVDGYAVYFDDLDPKSPTHLPIGGRAAAGHPLDRPMRRGEAIRIFTGAAMPKGTDGRPPDTVMMQEDCTVSEDPTGSAVVTIAPGIKRGANRRLAGEDVRAGDVVLAAGRRLTAADCGVCASLGLTTLSVYRRLRVALFSTGDELRDPGAALPDGAIFDANRVVLSVLLEGLGASVLDLGILPDRRDVVREALSDASGQADLVMTSGGVSVGEEDHVRAAVEAVGRIHLWRLAIKPGRPIAMGQIARTPFLALPGNPVAVMVTFLRIVRPMVIRLSGGEETAPRLFSVRSGFAYRKKPGRREWVRVRLSDQSDGYWDAERFGGDGAGVLTSMMGADGLVELPEDTTEVAAGDLVDYLPLREVMG